ncbi:hypothetical protein PPTG_07399 [Phytophthora nicotianae INRA-310]|uniref:Uncharacterized protein n=1 Tax=Phytophthora nicotianae (strain INRA-310) TaxID=761204 RepID=W2QPW6_PHYN3|nr:hypothetical protein PPTG_07399 [Phytophthora nicotianae INRA-310]ETN15237.1 hypothetical protein PPTG_07399 [Phytophthora nicotianae INRA-310]
MKRSPEDALDVSTDRLTCAERWEKILEQRECELYKQWLVTQPPSVERRAYPTSVGVMKRPPEDALDVSTDRLTCAERWEKILEQQECDEGRLDS